MKNIVKIIFLGLMLTILAACSGGGGSSAEEPADTGGGYETITMELELNQPTPVRAGFRVVNSSEGAVLDIIVIGEEKTVTLTAGRAAIEVTI